MITQLQIEINNVEADKIKPLRHSELRKGYNFSTTSYLKDYEEETFYLACIIDDMIITCATFYPQSSVKIKAKKAYRFRGMATDFNFKRPSNAFIAVDLPAPLGPRIETISPLLTSTEQELMISGPLP